MFFMIVYMGVSVSYLVSSFWIVCLREEHTLAGLVLVICVAELKIRINPELFVNKTALFICAISFLTCFWPEKFLLV